MDTLDSTVDLQSRLALLGQKSPHLSFELMCLEIEPKERDPSNYTSPNLDAIQGPTLCLYGIDPHFIVDQVLPLLEKRPDLTLFLLEEGVAYLLYFFMTEVGLACLTHPRITFDTLSRGEVAFDELALKTLKGPTCWLTSFVHESPCGLQSEAQKAHFHSAYAQLQGHLNLYKDFGADIAKSMFQHLTKERLIWGPSLQGVFEGVPAILCGAGPSLKEALPWLKQVQDRVLLIGAGSAVQMMIEAGLTPHLAVAIDPNPPLSRYQKEMEVPLCFQFQTSPEVVSQFKGQKLLWGTNELFPFEAFFMQALGLPESVMPIGTHAGTFASYIACHLGCKKVMLVGMEGCVSQGAQYAFEVDKSTLLTMDKEARNFKGERVQSKADFIQGAHLIEALIEAYPETTFLSFSDKGLYIKGCDLMPGDKERLLEDCRILTPAQRQKLLSEAKYIPLTHASLRTHLKALKETIEQLNEYNRAVFHWCQKQIEENLQGSLPCYQESLLVTEPFFDEVLRPIWDTFKPLIMQQTHEEGALFETLQKTLFLEQVIKAYLEIVKEEEGTLGAI